MPRERTFRTEAIVLRRSDFGEADRLLTLYSREYGKIRAIAKGARKPQSRKTGHVELFMRANYLLAQGRNLHIVTQAELVEPYAPLREDLVRATYAAYVTELLDKFAPDEEVNRTLYQLLTDALARFALTDNFLLAARHYELHLLTLVGFQPQLFRCVVSGATIVEEDQFFSVELGGLIAPGHERADRNVRPISAAAVKVLRYLQTRQWGAVESLQLRTALHRELENHLHAYLAFHLERQVKSAEFLQRLRNEAQLRDSSPIEPNS
ncbi:MAG: DNA repair protein RecO [Anaerolineae bacterium]|nr:DNA repair protein RecO [Anaerolineae bacterium]MCO5188902.1 DNA repair protein RecO [Anaerolineae bacterium]MCO5196151.1 DNA repair protein RecO [Anaerolineae bacterium]